MKKWEYEGSFLENFQPHLKGAIGNLFCDTYRRGYYTQPDQLCDAVEEAAALKLRQGYWTGESADALEILLQVIYSLDAQAFAEHIIWRESLPDDERRRLKQEAKAEGAKVWMREQPPTEKQLSYLKSLGCEKTPESKLEASELISELVKKRAA